MYSTRPQLSGLTNKERLSISIGMIALLLVVLAIAGIMQGTDLDEEQDLYCKAVDAGVYPDYNGNFHRVCPQAKDNHNNVR